MAGSSALPHRSIWPGWPTEVRTQRQSRSELGASAVALHVLAGTANDLPRKGRLWGKGACGMGEFVGRSSPGSARPILLNFVRIGFPCRPASGGECDESRPGLHSPGRFSQRASSQGGRPDRPPMIGASGCQGRLWATDASGVADTSRNQHECSFLVISPTHLPVTLT